MMFINIKAKKVYLIIQYDSCKYLIDISFMI